MGMNNSIIRRAIIDANGGSYSVSNGWIGIKCPFCGDSKRHNSRHLYIRIPEDNNDTLYTMRCFRSNCGFSDILRPKYLIALGVGNKDVINFINDNQHKSDYKRRVAEESLSVNELILPKEMPSKNVLDYIKLRTNKLFDDEYFWRKYKLITDVRKFITDNKSYIVPSKRLKELWDNHNDAVVFINDTGTRLYVRYINNKFKKHDKIPIIESPYILHHKPYSINSGVYEYNISGFHIVLMEGLFDAINVDLHVMGDIKRVIEATGSASAISNRFIHNSNYYYDVDWVFGKDSDVEMGFFKRLKEKNLYRFKNKEAYVIYSENTKDLGDLSKNPIPRKEKI